MAAVLSLGVLSGCGSNADSIKPDTEENVETEVKTWKTAIDGLPDGFIFGMDASSLLAEEKSGVKYYDFNGDEQDPRVNDHR